jgi:hypothetical protein
VAYIVTNLGAIRHLFIAARRIGRSLARGEGVELDQR